MCHLVNLQFQTGVMIGTHRVPEWAFHRCAAAKEQGRWHICGDGYKIVEQRSTDRDDCDDCWQHFRKGVFAATENWSLLVGWYC